MLAGAEELVVKVGQRAPRSVVGEVPPEPAPLARTLAAAPDFFAVAVEDDYVPVPPVVGVVALAWSSCPRAEVVEVPRCPFPVVVVVAGDGLGALLDLPQVGS
jgi:hypothetical protein